MLPETVVWQSCFRSLRFRHPGGQVSGTQEPALQERGVHPRLPKPMLLVARKAKVPAMSKGVFLTQKLDLQHHESSTHEYRMVLNLVQL